LAETLMILPGLIVIGATLIALLFRPWDVIVRVRSIQNPWLAALVILPWVWTVQKLVPVGVPLQLSGACLIVLMFGWPLAVITMLPVAAMAAWLSGDGIERMLQLAAWNGVLPATLALLIGLVTRRFLPHHLFVYILARGFITTAVALTLSGSLWFWITAPMTTPALSELLIGRWLVSWGEAFGTGGLTAIFVAFRPEWMLTYSDRRYLPGASKPSRDA
jgi:uncharacterized membrane protein